MRREFHARESKRIVGSEPLIRMIEMGQLFAETIRKNASDLHLVVGFPPMLRINGALFALGDLPPLSPQEAERLILSTLTK